MKELKLLETLFSVKDVNYHKTVYLFGIKINIKRGKTKKVFLHMPPSFGLGNRLNSIAYAVVYDSPNEIGMFWDNKKWVTSNFDDLFYYDSPIKISEINTKEQGLDIDKDFYYIDRPACKLLDGKKVI